MSNQHSTSNSFSIPEAEGGFKKTKNTDVPLMQNSTYPAILIGIIDLGTNDNEYNGVVKKRRTLQLTFEFPTYKHNFYLEDTEPTPGILSKGYTFSINSYQGKNSALLDLIQGIYGIIPKAQWNTFDIPSMLGKMFNVSVVQYQKRDQTIGNKIQSVSQFQPQFFQGLDLTRTNDLKLYHLNSGFQGPEFASLDKWAFWQRKEILSSDEAKAHAQKGGMFSKYDENNNLVLEQISQDSPQEAPSFSGGSPKIEMIATDFTREQYIASGWTDEALVQQGKARLVPQAMPQAPAPQTVMPQAPAPQVPTPQAPMAQAGQQPTAPAAINMFANGMQGAVQSPAMNQAPQTAMPQAPMPSAPQIAQAPQQAPQPSQPATPPTAPSPSGFEQASPGLGIDGEPDDLPF